MTTLADLAAGDEFLFACQVTGLDQVTGLSLALYGPGRVMAAAAVIAPTGVMRRAAVGRARPGGRSPS